MHDKKIGGCRRDRGGNAFCLSEAAMDELALRLSGLSGDAFEHECLRLTKAILAAMQVEGDIGTIERIVVLATLKAAKTKVAQMHVGNCLVTYQEGLMKK